ncbi:MAG TPA: YheV family putative metal-binding protein [Aeromonadales bacterium]|nr:YheV family putative metal-binding protein [Aeromonadales bacterium]
MSEHPLKKFIAGAICPNCHKTDGVRMWKEDHIFWQDCVYCTFKKSLYETPEANNKTRFIPVKFREI